MPLKSNAEEKVHFKPNCGNSSASISFVQAISGDKTIDYSNRKATSNCFNFQTHRNVTKNVISPRSLVKVPSNIPLNAEAHAVFIDGLVDPRIKKSHLINSTSSVLNLPLHRFATNYLAKIGSPNELIISFSHGSVALPDQQHLKIALYDESFQQSYFFNFILFGDFN